MRQALLCDLDGVLRRWPPMTERAHGVPPGALAAAAFAPDRLLPAVTGRCTDEQWRAAITADLAARTDRAGELVAAWSASAGEIDHEVAELLAGTARSSSSPTRRPAWSPMWTDWGSPASSTGS